MTTMKSFKLEGARDNLPSSLYKAECTDNMNVLEGTGRPGNSIVQAKEQALGR